MEEGSEKIVALATIIFVIVDIVGRELAPAAATNRCAAMANAHIGPHRPPRMLGMTTAAHSERHTGRSLHCQLSTYFGMVMVSTIWLSVSLRSDTAGMPDSWMRARD